MENLHKFLSCSKYDEKGSKSRKRVILCLLFELSSLLHSYTNSTKFFGMFHTVSQTKNKVKSMKKVWKICYKREHQEFIECFVYLSPSLSRSHTFFLLFMSALIRFTETYWNVASLVRCSIAFVHLFTHTQKAQSDRHLENIYSCVNKTKWRAKWRGWMECGIWMLFDELFKLNAVVVFLWTLFKL